MIKKRRRDRTASLRHEKTYYRHGYSTIFGIDEAGRGPWAGLVSAAAVCLPVGDDKLAEKLKGVRDSKKMTPLQREKLAEVIKETAHAWGIGSASVEEIDTIGILPSTQLAMQRAFEVAAQKTDRKPSCLFIDSVLLPDLPHIPQVSLIEGDNRSLSIAAASVLAKVWRDVLMIELDAQYPEYGFAVHKGYGTPQHEAALKTYGPCPIHRRSFTPVRKALGIDDEDE